jgi:hypothetical protein
MVWQTLKRDLRRLWPIALAVACVHWLNVSLLISGGKFSPQPGWSDDAGYWWIANIALPAASLLGLLILAIVATQRDRPPGSADDTLACPVSRGQLLAAKLLFIVVAGLGPIFLGDWFMGIAEHLRAIDTAEVSFRRTLMLFSLVCLPGVMIGTVTRSMTRALACIGVIIAVIAAVIALFSMEWLPSIVQGTELPTLESRYGWTIKAVLVVANILAAAVLLPLQFQRRRANWALWALGLYFCAAPAAVFLPCGAALTIQHALGHSAGEAEISFGIDSSREISFTPNNCLAASGDRYVSCTRVTVPVSISDRNPGEPWRVNYVCVNAVGSSMDRSSGPASVCFNSIGSDRLVPGDPSARLFLEVPDALFQAAYDQHAQFKVTLFLTTFRRVTGITTKWLDDRSVLIDGISRCGDSTVVDVAHCLSTSPVGYCVGDTRTYEPNLTDIVCGQPYTYASLPLWRDPYYPIEMQGVSIRGLHITRYSPEAHFARSLVFGADEAKLSIH